MFNEVTYLGKIINVDSSTIEADISDATPSAAPIIGGRIYKIGQIGTLVKIPISNITLYGVVSSVSNTMRTAINDIIEKDLGNRYLQIQLIGEKIGSSEFTKGVGTYPTINDEVHLVTEDDLKSIYGEYRDGLVEIGKHSSSENLPVYLELQNLVIRHSAILGSTGSGKSNTVANIIKRIIYDYKSSRIVLIDIHGEYGLAFQNDAKIFKIGDKENPLVIPFWAMTYDEFAFFLVNRQNGDERPESKELREKVVELKKLNSSNLKSGSIDPNNITSDSPVPFDIHQLWYDFNREVNATYNVSDQNAQRKETEELISEGDPQKLIPASFKPYSPDSKAPYKSKRQTMYGYLNLIHSRLRDPRFGFLFNPGNFSGSSSDDDLNDLLKSWIDHDNNLTILDLNGVPFELIDISVGLISRIIFDSMYWGRNESYTGRNRPILMVYEEAHTYLPSGESPIHIYGYAKKAVEKVFKEGRKFGVGAMVISQRPSEISETILSQVGTFIALRLTNSGDKSRVQAASPNNMSSLIDLLPSLRIGEAIVIGESIKVPTRVRISLVTPRPDSMDPDVTQSWKKAFVRDPENYRKIVTNWRQQKKSK
ncbi:ATP-binding protein [Methanothrix sp.]|uniref:ATP-binding protein n=1 Tax=Methanothrix sp. TaxID=90426 RepID=UPI003BB5BC21